MVDADVEDNPPSPGHRDALVYNYKGESVSVTCTVTGHVKMSPIMHYFGIPSHTQCFGVSGNSKIMHCGILFSMSYSCKFSMLMVHVYMYVGELNSFCFGV